VEEKWDCICGSAAWWEAQRRSPTFPLEYWWMGQKAEEQKILTVKTISRDFIHSKSHSVG